MKLILCSEGFSTKEIVLQCEKFVGKPRSKINIAVINEAYAVEHDDNLRWVLNNLTSVKDNFGGKLELINLLALGSDLVRERIKQHDVIFMVGGHTDYLMTVFEKSGFDKLLPELLKTKVYVGSSAGSMVIGKRLTKKAYEKLYENRNTYGITQFLGLVDIAIMPHLDSPHFPDRKKRLSEVARLHSGVVYGLNDDAAVVIDGESIRTIGSKPVIFNQ